jgi:hypothetical protein
MIAPTTVIEYINGLINDEEITYLPDDDETFIAAIEGSEDVEANADVANVITYADIDMKAELDTNKRIIKVPCSIYVIVTSTAFETAAESFNQAFTIALTIYNLIAENNRATLKDSDNADELIHIQAQEIPLTILQKTAAASSIQLAFTYFIKGM